MTAELEPLSADDAVVATYFLETDGGLREVAEHMAWEETIDFIKIDPAKLMYSIAPIGMTTYSEKKDLARQFLDFVMSEEGQAIFEERGYAPYFDPEEIGKVR